MLKILTGGFLGVVHALVLLTFPPFAHAHAQGQALAESKDAVVQARHAIPSWLQEGPFIQARSNMVSLLFIARRGHVFSYFRDIQERRGFADRER